MQISLITTEIQPLHETTWAGHAAALCTALSKAGHDVLVVSPLPESWEPSRLGLARRLTPFELVRGTQTVPVIRYEGKLPCGAKLTALSRERDPGKAELDLWFPTAAAQWLQAEAEGAAWHLATGPYSGAAAAWLLAGGIEKVGMLLMDSSQDSGWPAARDAMSKLKWVGLLCENGSLTSSSPTVETLNNRGLRSRVRALPLPTLAQLPSSASATEKGHSRLKASAQLRLGLPVLPANPLVFMETAGNALCLGVLSSALRHGLQVVCGEKKVTPKLDELRQTYPDRLALPGAYQPRSQFLQQADACIALDDFELAYESALCGTLPIVSATGAGMLTELSADLSNGSAVIASNMDPESFDAALGRFSALDCSRTRFESFRARLPGCVPLWAKTAAHLVELMNES
jgi:hypothetical protein